MNLSDDDFIAAIEAHGVEGAAKALGVNRRTVQRRKALLSLKGYSPQHDMTHPVPDGFKAKGVSTLYRDDGTVAAQWVKSTADAERQRQMLEAAFAGFADEIPRIKPTPTPGHTRADLLNCFVVTDYHMGMLAWGEETRGESWDLAKAEKLLVDWFAEAIYQAPHAGTAVLAQLGDFLHFDSLDAVTPEHRNLLDADTRFQKVVRCAVHSLRRVVSMLLERHDRVIVIMAEGNHDPASSVWLREWFAALYEDEPRVQVDRSPDPYYCVEFGKTSLFFHHGHKRRPGEITETFAAKFRDVLGRTKFSYAHMGHMHHGEVKENALMIVEQHQTLAAPDAYASRGGWLAQRNAKVICYSNAFGEVGRVVISPDAVRAAA